MVRRNQLGGRNQDLNPEIAADSILASSAYVSKDVIVPESLLSIQAGLVLINGNLDSPLHAQRSASPPFEKSGLDLVNLGHLTLMGFQIFRLSYSAQAFLLGQQQTLSSAAVMLVLKGKQSRPPITRQSQTMTVCRGRREMKRFVNGGSLHGSVDVASEDSMTSAIE